MSKGNNILRRKAEAAKIGRESRVISPMRALCRSVERAAQLGLNLPLVVVDAQDGSLDRDSLLGQVAAGGLMVSLDQDDGAPGLIVLDLQCLTALVEVQTLGSVKEKPAAARPVTRTDAAVAMPLIDGTLSGFRQLLAESGDVAHLSGFHFGSWVSDLRQLAAQLPDAEYQTYRLNLQIGQSQRTGEVLLALPVPLPPQSAETTEAKPALTIQDGVMDAPATLETILHRQELSLDQIALLKPGDVLTIPLAALSEVRLHTGDRQVVASGVLGKLGGNRAVRLTSFGPPRTVGAPQMAVKLPQLSQVDLSDPALVEPPRPRRAPPAPVAAEKPAPKVEKPKEVQKVIREDPTGTEALLSELGLSDLDAPMNALSLGSLDEEEQGAGTFMKDLPVPVRSK
ncbi:FliM/FliN family flagellar motor switch protein [Thalassobius vesicularis]|uniref:FliM/FliN family flagellar motor switch protein n=1 Tax=Thalassobius vesicularis TaxID=1294297 RepID=A0A4S3MCJ6_9RHOB|nr:FliM/FliN family flagellar motor switch protein [Thalassobius vesicularis]THD75582.1 FliM/FliN family flagellar motor switch protein [Thalassobius vesicularis]